MQTWAFLLTSVEFNIIFWGSRQKFLITREALLVTSIKFN